MYIGIDHGTTAIRFSNGVQEFKLSRESARTFSWGDLSTFGPPSSIQGIAVCYSMGDAITRITPIECVQNRGVVSREGAGKHIGGGTRVFDQIAESGLPAVVIPGLHRGSPTDPRFRVYSHQASPEKVGIAYEVVHDLGNDVIISDISSNTVTMLVNGGHLVGALDACIFAPGTLHGAIDVDAIRRIDRGELTANEAFQHAGVQYTLAAPERNPALALFAAMECAALRILNPRARVALSGSVAAWVAPEIERLLGEPVAVYDEWCAARGLARIARDVFQGKGEILGLEVEMSETR
ncbi:MAG: methanogenesis marker 12 protein [Methanomicrobiales archaeon]|nr:methanogenesis marker 12 protein [Methanomicrobiales archaeon]